VAEGAAKPKPTPRPGLIAAGLICAAIAVFMTLPSLKMIATALTHDRFVLDELRILNYDTTPGKGPKSGSGVIVSSGEQFAIYNRWLIEHDRAAELGRTGALAGHRVPVRYLPPSPFWSAVDRVVEFRVQLPEQFDLGLSVGFLATHVVFLAMGIVLFRRGLAGQST
jgi:hypothetical protein